MDSGFCFNGFVKYWQSGNENYIQWQVTPWASDEIEVVPMLGNCSKLDPTVTRNSDRVRNKL